MSVQFKRAVADDAERLVACQIAAFHHDAVLYPGVEVGGPPGYDSVDAMLRNIRDNDVFKMVKGDQIIGGLGIFVKGNGHYHLDVIFIHPDYHSQGIGTQAMQFLDTQYKDATQWTLDTPEWAVRNRHFYEKLGFKMVEAFEVDGFPLVAYERSSK